MVLYILKAENGQYLSAKQIQEKVFSELAYSITKETIVGAIDQAKYIISTLSEKTERRGPLKLPVKVFAIIPLTENLNTTA